MKKIKILFAVLSTFLLVGIITAYPLQDQTKANPIENVVAAISVSLILASTVVAFKFHKNFKGNKGHSNRELDIVMNGFDFTQKASMNPDSPNYGGIGNGGGSGKDGLSDLELKAKKEREDLLVEVKNLVTDISNKSSVELKDSLKTLNDKLEEFTKKGFVMPAEVTKTISDLALDVKALKENPVSKTDKKTIKSQLLANKTKIDNFLAQKSGKLEMELELKSEDSGDIDGKENYFTWHEGGAVGQIPVRRPFMQEMMTVIGTSTEFIKYIDQETIVRDAKNVAGCASSSSNTKVTWKTFTVQIQKIRDYIDICLDMISDYSFVTGEITRLLNTSLQLKIDNDLLLGNGSAPVLNGIASIASTFNASNAEAPYNDSTPSANVIDLISVCGAQIRAFGKQNAWFPNYVLVNPRTVQSMKQLKDGLGNYIKNSQLFSSLFQDAKGRYYIDGMLLVENPLVPVNELYIGDFTKATLYKKPGVGIEYSYENATNFETETVTVKVYERLNLLVRNVDKNAFMHVPSITAGVTAIDSSVS